MKPAKSNPYTFYQKNFSLLPSLFCVLRSAFSLQNQYLRIAKRVVARSNYFISGL